MFYAHSTAVIEEGAEIGDGTRIWHFAHIRKGAKIGKNCNIGKDVYIDVGVEIGDRVKIQNCVSIYRGVKIEDDVFIGPHVVFTNDLYPRAFIWGEDKIVSTLVKRGASIGANATVICGVTIGMYSMIGAGSVVTRDVPDFGLAFGNPAKLRGFVCYCGKKLKNGKFVGRSVVFHCECGKKVEIEIESYRRLNNDSSIETDHRERGD